MNVETEIQRMRSTIARLEILERELHAPWSQVCALLGDMREALKKAEIEHAILQRLSGMKEENHEPAH